MLFKAKIWLASMPAKIYEEDPDHPEEFTREALLQKELMTVYAYFATNGLYGPMATPTGITPDGWTFRLAKESLDEPFPEPGWECVSFPLLGHTQYGIPLGCDELCRQGKRWLGIEIEYPEVPAKYAVAWAPDGEEMFGENYSEKPPSFYDGVKEYFPVWKIKAAAAGED